MSLERIREWMHANPQSAEEVLRQNRSFVFFRIVGLSDDHEPRDAQGLPTERAVRGGAGAQRDIGVGGGGSGAGGITPTPEPASRANTALFVSAAPFFTKAD